MQNDQINNETVNTDANESTEGATETSQALSLEQVQQFIEKDESARKHFQSQRDRTVRESIKKFMGQYADEEGNMEAIVNRKLQALRDELTPQETEAEKQLREMRQQVEELRANSLKKDLMRHAIVKAREYDLPNGLDELIKLGSDEESTEANVAYIANIFQKAVEEGVNRQLKGDVRKPDRSKLSVREQLLVDQSNLDDEAFFKQEIEKRKKAGLY